MLETDTVLSELFWFLQVGYSTFFKHNKESYVYILTLLNSVHCDQKHSNIHISEMSEHNLTNSTTVIVTGFLIHESHDAVWNINYEKISKLKF